MLSILTLEDNSSVEGVVEEEEEKKDGRLPSHKKDQPVDTYHFVPLNIYYVFLGVVDCNSEKSHVHAYVY